MFWSSAMSLLHGQNEAVFTEKMYLVVPVSYLRVDFSVLLTSRDSMKFKKRFVNFRMKRQQGAP